MIGKDIFYWHSYNFDFYPSSLYDCYVTMTKWNFLSRYFFGFCLKWMSGWFLFHQFFGRFTKIHLIFTHSTQPLEKGKCEFYSETNTILIMWTWTGSLSPPSVESSSPPSSGLSVNRGLSDVDHQTSFRRFPWCVFCICWQSSDRFSFWFPLHLFTIK